MSPFLLSTHKDGWFFTVKVTRIRGKPHWQHLSLDQTMAALIPFKGTDAGNPLDCSFRCFKKLFNTFNYETKMNAS